MPSFIVIWFLSYEHIIQNGQTTLGYLWKALKPLGIVSDAKALHNRLFYFYSSKAFAFRRLPLIYEQRTPQNWTDRTWILKLNEHISAAGKLTKRDVFKRLMKNNLLIHLSFVMALNKTLTFLWLIE